MSCSLFSTPFYPLQKVNKRTGVKSLPGNYRRKDKNLCKNTWNKIVVLQSQEKREKCPTKLFKHFWAVLSGFKRLTAKEKRITWFWMLLKPFYLWYRPLSKSFKGRWCEDSAVSFKWRSKLVSYKFHMTISLALKKPLSEWIRLTLFFSWTATLASADKVIQFYNMILRVLMWNARLVFLFSARKLARKKRSRSTSVAWVSRQFSRREISTFKHVGCTIFVEK